MARQQWSWTPLQLERATIAGRIILELKPWWPVTVRGIHYQLFSHLVQWRPGKNGLPGNYQNTKSESNMMSKLLKWMRIDEIIPWEAITDGWRNLDQPRKHEDYNDYIAEEVDWFLSDYRRCLLQNQPRYIEVWVEKHALYHIIRDIAKRYCLTTRVTRYDSVTHLKAFIDRAKVAIERGQEPWILYFGDLDPSGVDMEDASQVTLRDELSFDTFVWERMAITVDQVSEYDLPYDPTAGKSTDPRYRKYIAQYGKIFVELDTLHPATLQSIVRDSIEAHLDMEDFKEQKEIEEQEQERIDKIKVEVERLIKSRLFGLPNK